MQAIAAEMAPTFSLRMQPLVNDVNDFFLQDLFPLGPGLGQSRPPPLQKPSCGPSQGPDPQGPPDQGPDPQGSQDKGPAPTTVTESPGVDTASALPRDPQSPALLEADGKPAEQSSKSPGVDTAPALPRGLRSPASLEADGKPAEESSKSPRVDTAPALPRGPRAPPSPEVDGKPAVESSKSRCQQELDTEESLSEGQLEFKQQRPNKATTPGMPDNAGASPPAAGGTAMDPIRLTFIDSSLESLFKLHYAARCMSVSPEVSACA
jgi:hypothetical protein